MVLAGLLNTENIDRFPLEELIIAEFEGSLSKVASKGWARASQESTGTFFLHNLTETSEHTLVVGAGVELDPGLDTAKCQYVWSWSWS